MPRCVSLVVAVASNGIIGRNNSLPWRLSSDLRRFKRITTGHWLLMGRTTYESLPGPLPDRRLIVLTRDPGFRVDREDVFVRRSLEEAFSLPGEDELLFVVGGAQVYSQTLERADEILRTRVLAEVDGDTRLPEWDLSDFVLVEREDVPAGERDQYPSVFERWVRRAHLGLNASDRT